MGEALEARAGQPIRSTMGGQGLYQAPPQIAPPEMVPGAEVPAPVGEVPPPGAEPAPQASPMLGPAQRRDALETIYQRQRQRKQGAARKNVVGQTFKQAMTKGARRGFTAGRQGVDPYGRGTPPEAINSMIHPGVNNPANVRPITPRPLY